MTATTANQLNLAENLKWCQPLLRSSTSFTSEVTLCLCALVFALLTSMHLLNWDSTWQSENALMVFCVTLVAATACPQTPILALMLISSIVWCESDLRNETSWTNYLLAYAVRCASTVMLVFWTSRAQSELKHAHQAARVDDLTGILNRMAIRERLEAEVCRARRFGRPLSIAMLDCDGFKQINDSRGHRVGDECLKKVARTLSDHARVCDHVGRLGGDEFVMIFPEAGEQAALAIIARLRTLLHKEVTPDYPSLTFSIGVSTIDPPLDRAHRSVDWFEGLRQADEAMYVAKHSGGNQTHFKAMLV